MQVQLPDGSIALNAESSAPKPAFLIRLPEDAWASLEAAAASSSDGFGAGGTVQISPDGSISLHLPDAEPLLLEARSIGNSTEIHHLSSTSSPDQPLSLDPIATASTRLTVPLTSGITARAADKLRQQHDAHDKERKERAERVNGVAGRPSSSTSRSGAGIGVNAASRLLGSLGTTGMGRTQSSPGGTGTATVTASSSASSAKPSTAIATAPVPLIPLKTRVIQLLALGATPASEIVKRVGGGEMEVMRVVRVVGKCTNPSPPSYTLDPSQYSKIKIANWKYTYAEKRRVIELARAAFDELGLEEGAEERIELDSKEAEAMTSHTSVPAAGSASGSASRSNSGGGSSGESSSSVSEGAAQPFTPSQSNNSLPVAVQTQSQSSLHGYITEPSPKKPISKSSAAGSTGSGSTRKSTVEKADRDKEREKKDKAPQSLIGKQMAKFRAESAKRSSSLPNGKVDSGSGSGSGHASPRVRGATPVSVSGNGPTTVDDHKDHATGMPKVKPKGRSETVAEAKKRKRPVELKDNRRHSRDYTSSEGEDSDGRSRNDNGASESEAENAPRSKKSKGKGVGLGSGKEEQGEERGRARVVKVARGRGGSVVESTTTTQPSTQSHTLEGKETKTSSTRIKKYPLDSTVERSAPTSSTLSRSNSRTTPSVASGIGTGAGSGAANLHTGNTTTTIVNGQTLTHGLPPKPVSTLSASSTTKRISPPASVPPAPAPAVTAYSLRTSPPTASRSTSTSPPDSSAPRPLKHPNANANPDPEALRERYEELFPAYQLLAQRLAAIHQACEDVSAGGAGAAGDGVGLGVSAEELTKLVGRWERWHKELEGIRRWFGGGS